MATDPPISASTQGTRETASSVVAPVRLACTQVLRGAPQPIRLGVPFAPGMLHDVGTASLRLASGARPLTDCTVLARWSDHSVKWALAEALLTDLMPGETQAYLEITPGLAPPVTTFVTGTDPQGIRVETGSHQVLLQIHGIAGRLCQVSTVTGKDLGDLRISLAAGRERACRLNLGAWQVEHAGRVRQTYTLRGTWPQWPELALQVRLSLYAGTGLMQCEVTLHNQRRARHEGGLWDLGDAGSCLIRDFSLHCFSHRPMQGAFVSLDAEQSMPLAAEQQGLLVQHSSGGRNWRSRNHVDAHGRVPLTHWGYDWQTFDGSRHCGARANPTVARLDADCLLAVAPVEFWQQFPKALRVGKHSISVGLFPSESEATHELQGGERKRHTTWVQWADTSDADLSLDWVHAPPRASLSPEWHAESKVWPCLLPIEQDPDERLALVLAKAVSGDKSFESKREAIDEYGWRNYGDVWADHEAAFYQGTVPVISHYNNQFDLLLGSLLQWTRTGDDAWWRIGAPLANHVMDIDIYHTTEDKAAFSGGMFWHTDHYLSAETATHRTYSKANQRHGSYGGGPSNEHLYTGGLAAYYYLTGDVAARDCVIGLADWVLAMDDGRKSPWTWLESSPTGLASRTFEDDYHGPGRGAANSLQTLLDAWELTGETRYFQFAEALIARCIHPQDDLIARDLLSAERRWSYTMFLTALDRYLALKAALGELDRQYAYAQQSLLAYAAWMVKHERPYLDRPEELEYVTETWAAQELRKANALYLAAAHADESLAARCELKALELSEAAWKALLAFPTLHVTRVIAIVASEGTRNVWLQGSSRAKFPVPNKDFAFGEPSRFVPALARLKQRLGGYRRPLSGALGWLSRRLRRAPHRIKT